MNAKARTAENNLFRGAHQPLAIIVTNNIKLPFDGLLGGRPEKPRLFEATDRSVVIAENGGDIALAQDVDDFIGLGIVAREVTEAENAVGVFGVNGLKHRFGSLQIGVEVGDYRYPHLTENPKSQELTLQLGLCDV